MRHTKKGSKHPLQERRVKYEFIREHAAIFPIGKMSRVFQVDPSCFYRWQKGLSTSTALHKVFITSEITRIYHWSQCRYVSPRIAKELSAIGIKVSRTFVAKIMMENYLRSIVKTKFRKTTNSSHRYLTAQNILEQDFKTARYSEVWF